MRSKNPQEPQEPHSAQRELVAHFPYGIMLTISTAWILIALINSAYYEDVLEEHKRLVWYQANRAFSNPNSHSLHFPQR